MDVSLLTILSFGGLMSLVALVGGFLFLLPADVLDRGIKLLVAFAAGSMIGGAFFHMLPHALATADSTVSVMPWVVTGFALFFALDQLLEWHHCRGSPSQHVRPLGPLLLAADGLHNFLGGLAIGAIFLVDFRAGLAAWTAAVLHEIPQEIGDFGALVHSGYSRLRALAYNFLSALAFPIGGLIVYLIDQTVDVHIFIALGVGNFIYIASSDLIPEVKQAERLYKTAARFALFALGTTLLYLAAFHR